MSILMLQEVRIPGWVILKSLWGNLRPVGAFSFSYPHLINGTWLIYCYLNWFTFFPLSPCANHYLSAYCGNNQSHMTLCPSIPVSLYPKKVRGSKYVPIWWLWALLRDSCLLHRPFLIRDPTHKGSLTSSFSQKLLVWWRKCTSCLSRVTSTQLN